VCLYKQQLSSLLCIFLGLLHDAVSSQQNLYPEAVHFIAGDLNHVELKAVLPRLHQHVKCGTRGENMLDKIYSNIKLGFRAKTLPHLGQSVVVATVLHAATSHPEQRGSYARLLFVDFSSAFNTILPNRLVSTVSELGISDIPGQCCQVYDNYRICTIILPCVRCMINNPKKGQIYDNLTIL